MSTYDKVYNMNTNFGIWNYSDRLRITYLEQGWLVVWDQQQSPPTRYDCQHIDHETACASVVSTIREILTSRD